MQYEIYYKPTYSLAEVRLLDGESIQAERRSMAYMSANFKVSTGIKGGVLRGLKRTVLGGEDIFLNTFGRKVTRSSVSLLPTWETSRTER